MDIFVISVDGECLMPTSRCGKVRHLLEDGKAKIVKHNPFTIRLLYKTTAYTQPVELCMDAGYEHIGVSVKSESKEYVSTQYDALPDEKEHHDDCRKYRRTRRNRLRYRRCKNLRRNDVEDWFAPSIDHKKDIHEDIALRFESVCPITSVTIETGQFDTKELEAIKKGLPLPEGKEYQEPKIHADAVLRLAVFQRDNYKCAVCGKSGITDGAQLHMHHGLFWKGIHGNNPDEMLTVCSKCHTSANHKKGGKLYGLEPRKIDLRGAAFMNAVRCRIVEDLRKKFGKDAVHVTWGADTKEARKKLNIDKSHTNDAYCMGKFHPEKRAVEEHFKKMRRNNRILEKFYDAKYVDIRDGSTKSGSQLGCGRTNRSIPRNNDQNLRIYHGEKVSKGRRSIRRRHYSLRPKDVVIFQGKKYLVKGVQNHGTYVSLEGGISVAIHKVQVFKHTNAWCKIQKGDGIHPQPIEDGVTCLKF